MAIHLERELEELKKNLLSLSGMVEESVARAVRALKTMDVALAQKVIDSDMKIDLREVAVEEECLKVLALHQPVAVDLRFVIATLKINNDLERVADLSVNIAERVKFLAKKPQLEIPFDFDTMALKTRTMLKRALDALVQMDARMAEEVCSLDNEIDDMNRKVYDLVYAGVNETPDRVQEFIHYLSVSRHLERIADYATNISEDVIYMIEGTIVRHSPEEFGGDSSRS